MKKFALVFTAVALVGLVSAAESFAQQGAGRQGSGGWGTGSQYGRLYDAKTVETISGEVVSVDKITPMNGMSAGVYLQLKTEKETVSIHLGPAWFIENQDVKIEAKDKIEVKGSRVTFDGKPAIIAAEVKKGDEVLKLRDETGVPVWAGWRKR